MLIFYPNTIFVHPLQMLAPGIITIFHPASDSITKLGLHFVRELTDEEAGVIHADNLKCFKVD